MNKTKATMMVAIFLLLTTHLSVGNRNTLKHTQLTNVNVTHNAHNTQKHKVTHVSITCYQPVKSQCAGNPLVTSDGSHISLNKLKAGKIRWCAVSRDLLTLFPKNKPKRIKITGCQTLNGIWEVKDVTNKRFKHREDLLIHPQDKTRYKTNNIKIYIQH